jgi:hypothetical protein
VGDANLYANDSGFATVYYGDDQREVKRLHPNAETRAPAPDWAFAMQDRRR